MPARNWDNVVEDPGLVVMFFDRRTMSTRMPTKRLSRSKEVMKRNSGSFPFLFCLCPSLHLSKLFSLREGSKTSSGSSALTTIRSRLSFQTAPSVCVDAKWTADFIQKAVGTIPSIITWIKHDAMTLLSGHEDDSAYRFNKTQRNSPVSQPQFTVVFSQEQIVLPASVWVVQ